MPSGTRNYAPDYYTISSFFGASQNTDGTYSFTGQEKIPDNWTNRIEPYSDFLVGAEILKMYALHPVMFGGNTANGTFDAINFGAIQNGMLPVDADPKVVSCLLYQIVTERVPSSLNSIITPTVTGLSFVLSKLAGTSYANLGCPQALTK